MGTSPPKTVEWAFDTYIGAAIATATSLGAATRHDFPALTVYLPEGSPTFVSAFVEITYRDASATASNHQAHRIGLKLGANAFQDQDVSFSVVVGQSGEHETLIGWADVTSQLTSQWTGTSMAVQVGFAAQQAAARNVQNMTAKLILTYTHDDTLAGSPTRIKTIRIPLQSQTTSLTTVAQEIGTDGTAPAPANQIPALDTYLPESGKVYRRAWLQIECNDNASAATTDFALEVQIDATAAMVRTTLEQALATCVWFRDNVPYDTSTHSTASAHAFKAYSALTNRFRWLFAVLYVTYEYDEEDTRTGNAVINQAIIPCRDLPSRYMEGTTSATGERLTFKLHVGEPGTITLKQSAILLDWHNVAVGDANFAIYADGQSARTYDGHNAGVSGGEWSCCHRVDHASSTWSLAAGENTLYAHVYSDTLVNEQHFNNAFALLTWTSGCHPDGTHVHQMPQLYFGAGAGTATGGGGARLVVAAAAQKMPTLPAHYRISAFFSMVYLRENNSVAGTILTTLVSGEAGYPGRLVRPYFIDSDAETGFMTTNADWTEDCRLTDQATGNGFEVDTAREMVIRVDGTSLTVHVNGIVHVLSSHSCEYEVSGTVTGYTGDGSGITVDVYRVADKVWIASATTAAGGTYTAKVYDPSQHFAVARQSSTLVGRSDNVTPA